ncbi:transcription factor TGA9-like isoform X2 [Salvia hispanica]|uniref:transcription factor TGA9-like isoform X2 n=1 Tax=Salvia hispanica TaxID=49212 RepID=UPI002009AA64|nr:transcription factor TGA9-like isoform X2 [Salvia hispanica]
MASHRVGEPAALSDSGAPHHHHHHHHIPYAVPHMLHHPTNSNFINQEGPAFDFGELEEAIILQGVKINNDDKKQHLYTAIRPAATLDMFPSWPMRFHQHTTRGSSKSGEESTDSGSAVNTLSNAPESPSDHRQPPPPPQMDAAGGIDSPRMSGSQSQPPAAKPAPEKTLRRLAQNREAARKSRLRKKAYVQQLESSRIRLAQLEQDLQRARSQGLFLGGGGAASGSISSGGAIFDMEYSRWLDDDHRHISELRTALQAHLSDSDLRVIVDGYIAHYDEVFSLKGAAAKSDVFHLITGMWTTPAERCFLWMGGFRPSDLIKMLIPQLDPLTEQQFMGICSLQHSSQQAEEALSQGLDQLQQSLVDTIANGSVNDSMHHMAVALGKLANLEGFVRQADNLRQQTLHQLHRLLTIRQAARCFLVIGEYYGRLRALSSLWASRPRESMIAEDNSCQTTSDLQMVQASQNQFSNF